MRGVSVLTSLENYVVVSTILVRATRTTSINWFCSSRQHSRSLPLFSFPADWKTTRERQTTMVQEAERFLFFVWFETLEIHCLWLCVLLLFRSGCWCAILCAVAILPATKNALDVLRLFLCWSLRHVMKTRLTRRLNNFCNKLGNY